MFGEFNERQENLQPSLAEYSVEFNDFAVQHVHTKHTVFEAVR